MRKGHAVREYSRIASRALLSGAEQHSSSYIEWKASGSCESPVYVECNTSTVGSVFADGGRLRTDRHTTEIWARCRKCAPCLRARAMYWRTQIRLETDAANRTWFGTLTLRPDEHFKALVRARLRLSRSGIDFDALSIDQQFGARHQVIGPDLTKFLKRVRKESAAKLRYCLVAERHKSGLPHYHLVVHEVGGQPVRHKTLQGQWKLGFSNWKLVDVNDSAKSAAYVAKYLSKCAEARVRASKRYGQLGRDLRSINIDGTSCKTLEGGLDPSPPKIKF